MSKVCINCGREMSMLDKSIKLNFAEAHICRNCSEEAEDMLDFIKNSDLQFGIKTVEEKFHNMLDTSSYSTVVRSCIRDEFDLWKSSHMSKKLVITKYFKVDYEDCCDKIYSIGQTIAQSIHNMDSIHVGEVKTTSFVLEKYYSRLGHYSTLTVNLISYKDISAITTICTGAASLPNFGAEKDFLGLFWNGLRKDYGLWMTREIDRVEADGLNHNKIGILGGTFDPIHLGHKALGEAAIREIGLRKLIVMPAKMQPFKQGKKVAEPIHRMTMTKLAFKDNDKVEVSDYEMMNTEVSYTYDTLTYLKGVYPEDTLYFILGTDSFLQLESWYKGIDFLKTSSFAVSVRLGYKEEELEDRINYYRKEYGTRVSKIYAQMPDVSSTEVRNRLQLGTDAKDLIPDSVERYIKEHGLYKQD